MARSSLFVSKDIVKVRQEEFLQHMGCFCFHYFGKCAAVWRIDGIKGNGEPLGREERNEGGLANA